MKQFSKLTIVIPAFNEGKTIHPILDKIREVELVKGIDKEIILVNDCSTDDTEEASHRYIQQNNSADIFQFLFFRVQVQPLALIWRNIRGIAN